MRLQHGLKPKNPFSGSGICRIMVYVTNEGGLPMEAIRVNDDVLRHRVKMVILIILSFAAMC